MIAFYYALLGRRLPRLLPARADEVGLELRRHRHRPGRRRASCSATSSSRRRVRSRTPDASYSGQEILGVAPPLAIGYGFLLLGVVLMIVWRLTGEGEQLLRAPCLRGRRSGGRRRRRARRGGPGLTAEHGVTSRRDPRRARRRSTAPAAGARPPLAPLHAHGRLPRRRGADHRPRRGLLPRGRERQALPRRARGPLRGPARLLARRRDRRGRARADEGAAVLHELVVRAPARDRARRRARLARARRPQPRLLRLGRLGGGRVGLEARAPVPRRPRRAPLEGDLAANGLPRDDDGRAVDQRHRGAQDPVRAARAGRPPRAQHEPLPPAARGDGGGVHRVPARRPRGDDPRGRAGHRRDGDHGAGPERRRLVHAAGRLLPGRARDLRPLRDPALRGRGDLRVRPPRRVVRLGALRHPARPDHLREGALVRLRGDRRGDRDATP